jgi:threonine dehydratase
MSFSNEIEELQARLTNYIRVTPTINSPVLSRELNSEIYLKLELLQYTGAFKVRGALSKMLSLSPEEIKKGVVAFSAGNHGLGVAFAAKLFNTTAKIFVPSTISELKKNALIFWGADLVIAGSNPVDLKEKALETSKQEGKILIPPFDDEAVIKGQATIGVELLQAVPDLEAIVISIGGGGLISGIAEYLKAKNPKIDVYGVETIGAESMTVSLNAGKLTPLDNLTSIADSLGAKLVCERTLEATKRLVSEVVTVTDREAIDSLEKLINYEKVFCEPAASCTLSAVEGPLREKIKGRKTALLLCGGNFSISQLKAFK